MRRASFVTVVILAIASLATAAACSGSSTPEATPTASATSTADAEATPTLTEILAEIEARTSAIRGLSSDAAFEVRFTTQAGLDASLAALGRAEPEAGTLVNALGLADARILNGAAGPELGAFISAPATIFVVGNAADGLDEQEVSIYVHEYVHFLQTASYPPPELAPGDVDAEFAYRALREGDAVATEREYQRRYLETVRPEAEQQFGTTLGERFDGALTLFTYGGGPDFVEAIGGAGTPRVDELFDGSLTTEQVIHPEKFASGEGAREVSEAALLAELGLDASTVVDRATLGEFFYLGWLTALGSPTAFSGAAGWGGDLVLVTAEDDGFVFVFRIEWDDPALDAAEFDRAVRAGLDVAPPANATEPTFLALPAGQFDAWQGPRGVVGVGTTEGKTTMIVAPTRARMEQLLAVALGSPAAGG
jgi:hypothetical protein